MLLGSFRTDCLFFVALFRICCDNINFFVTVVLAVSQNKFGILNVFFFIICYLGFKLFIRPSNVTRRVMCNYLGQEYFLLILRSLDQGQAQFIILLMTFFKQKSLFQL